jgi:hypothetical protein
MLAINRSSIPHGTLDLLILQTPAAEGKMRGFEIVGAIL